MRGSDSLDTHQNLENRYALPCRSFLSYVPHVSGKFLVLPFEHHSCTLVLIGDGSESVSIVPIDTQYAEHRNFALLREDRDEGPQGALRTRRVCLPRALYSASRASMTTEWCSAAVHLMIDESVGAFKKGQGRARGLPDNRTVPSSTYVTEWLLPILSPSSLSSLPAAAYALGDETVRVSKGSIHLPHHYR